MSAPVAQEVPPVAPIPGEELPLAALADLVREVEAAEAVGAEDGPAHAVIEARLAELRAAWPDLAPAERALLGRLVTGITARRPPAGDGRGSAEGPGLAEALERLGVRRLRPGQDRAIAAALAGRDALVVMATGSGKSLCYQAPAAALRGLTVVVSPLIALMTDQLGGAPAGRHPRGGAPFGPVRRGRPARP